MKNKKIAPQPANHGGKVMGSKFLQICVAAVLIGLPSMSIAKDLDHTELNVVAGVSTMNQYLLGEKPFYETVIVEDSEGAVSANVTSLDSLNIGGTDVMRLIESGATDIGTSAFAYFGNEVPAASGVDLPGLFSTLDELRAGVDAYRPVLDKTLAEQYNAKLLGVWGISNIMVFCRGEVTSLADLKGKNIRSYGTMLSALYEGLGANPITLAYAEVVPALERGTLDCATTGALSGNVSKWGEVSDTLYQLPIGPSNWFTAMNLDRWSALSPELQTFLAAEFTKLEDRQWELARRENIEALSCAAGKQPCTLGVLDDMTVVAFDEADMPAFRAVVKTKVLPVWFELCGAECEATWRGIVGPLVHGD
ncbi:TRAP transporter substrate-binding protein [Tistrella bauzanensis]|uniref:TRAP transporter substrate-binding protein n=1 Tax=Tistrella arctica TaxID=3133430 RepID=A0ABU9YHU0_9PROT